ncbi:MAG: NAD(P)H-hydrate dehydratase [Chloroflexota bacterium]
MRAWEQAAIDQGIDVAALMQKAGRGVAAAILAEARCKDPLLVLAGPGNNGGDALIAASLLREQGRHVQVALWRRPQPDGPEEAAIASTSVDRDGMAKLQTWLGAAGTVIDGLLGTGRSRPAEGALRDILQALAQRRRQPERPIVVAVDLPSGTAADTGAMDDLAVAADMTVALGCAKGGTLVFPAAGRAGAVQLADIGLPAASAPRSGQTIDIGVVAGLLPARTLDSNKGSFGRVTVIGGSEQYTGAPALVARAAGRAGAGLVAVAMPRCVHAILATKLDEAIFAPQPDQEGALAPSAVDGLATLARRSQAVAIGPGLSQSAAAPETIRALLQQLLADHSSAQFVIDADALNALAQQQEWWRHMPPGCVLTPHPGEMGRLTGTDARSVQANRIGIARTAAERWQQHVLLKGAHTIVACPDGQWWLLPVANAALATAGTGDVLCGTIAGLLAQGMEPGPAAVCGAWAHAEAGLVAARQYGNAGVLAGDLLPELPRALQRARTFAAPTG